MYRLLISLFLSPKLSLTTVGRHGITVYLCKRRWVYVCVVLGRNQSLIHAEHTLCHSPTPPAHKSYIYFLLLSIIFSYVRNFRNVSVIYTFLLTTQALTCMSECSFHKSFHNISFVFCSTRYGLRVAS
jgi:hypothetical protein